MHGINTHFVERFFGFDSTIVISSPSTEMKPSTKPGIQFEHAACHRAIIISRATPVKSSVTMMRNLFSSDAAVSIGKAVQSRCLQLRHTLLVTAKRTL